MSTRGKKITPILIVVALIVLSAGYFLTRDYTVEIRQDQLQKVLDNQFPISDTYLKVFTLTLADPKLELRRNTDRVFFSIRAQTNIPVDDEDLHGDATVSGRIRYAPEEGAFYLAEIRVERLHLSHKEESYGATMRLALSVILNQLFKDNPVYMLDLSDRAQSLAKRAIKEIAVSDGKVRITVGLGK